MGTMVCNDFGTKMSMLDGHNTLNILSDDEESIGTLPVLERKDSLRKLGIQQATGVNNDMETKRRSTPTSIDTRLRLQSLQPQARAHSKFSERRTKSMRPHQSARPDPPAHSQRYPSGRASKSPMMVERKVEDPFPSDPPRRAVSLHHPKQPRRTISLPFVERAKERKARYDLKKELKATGQDTFIPRASRFGSRVFPEHKITLNDDVWIQRMVLVGDKKPEFIFKSVFSRECRAEPPTGALNIVYMEDIVKIRSTAQQPVNGNNSRGKKKSTTKKSKGTGRSTRPQETAPVTVDRSWKKRFSLTGKRTKQTTK